MPGRSPRQKGNRVERKIVDLLDGMNLKPQRVPNSGSSQGEFGGDIRFDLPTALRVAGEPALVESEDGRLRQPRVVRTRRRSTAEVKARAAGWKTIEAWLANYDALFLVKDRSEPMVVLPWRVFDQLASMKGD